MNTLYIKTSRKDDVIDITDEIQQELEKINFQNGLCHLFVLHTTCCITAADLDPGTDLDLLDALRHIAPKLDYRHPHDPDHAPDHILSSIIGPSLMIPVKNGELILGTWQRIILIELDVPRERKLICSFIKE